MKREVATQWQDRPHESRSQNRTPVCECGRAADDELHSHSARELASADVFDSKGLSTEKGS